MQLSRWLCYQIVALFAVLLTFSCASQQARKPVPFKIMEMATLKQIGDHGSDTESVNTASHFSYQDPQVIAFIKMRNLSGNHKIRWDWIQPDGKIYTSSGDHPMETTAGRYRENVAAWHPLYIKGEKAATLPGIWGVKIYIDNDQVASEKFEIAAPPPALVLQPGQRNAFAVVVGISRYQHNEDNLLPDLAFADDDATSFSQVLRHMGWSDSHIRLLVNEDATRENISIALQSWLTKAGPEDVVVVFWSGHGFKDPENPQKSYFACYDTKMWEPATGYRMDHVRTELAELKTKNVIVFADTCHAGAMAETRGIGVANPYLDQLKEESAFPKGWVWMVGADTDRQAIESKSWKNGAFTHVILKGFSGEADAFQGTGIKDSIVTLGELRAFIQTIMPDETAKVIGVAKHPTIITSSNDPEVWKLSLNVK
jgi:hypothetical protein